MSAMQSQLSPNSTDALLFDIGRVVLDIDFGRVMANWAGHAGCEPAHHPLRMPRLWHSGKGGSEHDRSQSPITRWDHAELAT